MSSRSALVAGPASRPVVPQVQSPSLAPRPWNQMSGTEKVQDFLSDYFYYIHKPSVFNPKQTIESFRVNYLSNQFLYGGYEERNSNCAKFMLGVQKAGTFLGNAALTGCSVAGRVFFAFLYTVVKVFALVLFNYFLYADHCQRREQVGQVEMAPRPLQGQVQRPVQQIPVQPPIQIQAPSVPLPPPVQNSAAPIPAAPRPAAPRRGPSPAPNLPVPPLDLQRPQPLQRPASPPPANAGDMFANIRQRAQAIQLRQQGGLVSPRQAALQRGQQGAANRPLDPRDAMLRELEHGRERLHHLVFHPAPPAEPQPGQPIDNLVDLLAVRRAQIAGHIANIGRRRGSESDSDGGF